MNMLTVLNLEFEANGAKDIIYPVLLSDENEMVLIDCGYPGFLSLIEKCAIKNNIDLNNLTKLIITHHDFDHMGSLGEFKRKYPNIKVMASSEDALYIEGKKKSLRLQQAESIYESLPNEEKVQAEIFHKTLASVESCKVDTLFNDGDILDIAGGIEVVATPGHMPGHISLYHKESKSMVAGDALVLENGKLSVALPKYTLDIDEALKSIKKISNYKMDRIICYHGGIYEKTKMEEVKMEILVLNAEEIENAINIKEAIEADKLALKSYSSGDANIPLRINLDIEAHKGQSLYMPGYSSSSNALGVKLVSVYPNNIEKGITTVPALMLLVDDETGVVNCMMDGTCLTQLRTGAVSGAATELLSREDSNIFTLIGTGGQAALQLEAVLAVRDIRTAYVFDINKQRQKEFAEKMQERFGNTYNVEIKGCDNLESAIRESDIITSVTTAKSSTFNGEWVKKGAHVNGVGSYTPEMAEIDSSLILRADKIYYDTKDAIVESGDFVQMIENGIFTEESVTGELGQLLLEITPGRETDDEITFFETTGNAVLDIVVAKKIYDCAVGKKIGKTINL